MEEQSERCHTAGSEEKSGGRDLTSEECRQLQSFKGEEWIFLKASRKEHSPANTWF